VSSLDVRAVAWEIGGAGANSEPAVVARVARGEIGLELGVLVPALDRHQQGPGGEVQARIRVLRLGSILVVERARELGIESGQRSWD